MLIGLLTAVSLFVLLGHLVAIVRDRYYWPFSHYPMYSYAVRDMQYPVLDGRALTAFTLVAVFADGSEEDILANASIYPPLLHPLDRIEVNVLMLHVGLPGVRVTAARNVGFEVPADDHGVRLDDVLRRLAGLAASRSGRPLAALRLVRLSWPDFRAADTAPSRDVVAEVVP